MPLPPIERPKRTLWTRREQRQLRADRSADSAGYFLFVFLRVFFEVLRAAFFAAMRTVDLFFRLLAVIGMKQLPLQFRKAQDAPPKTAGI